MKEYIPILGSWIITLTVAALTVAASLLVPLPVILAGAAGMGLVGWFVFDDQLVEYLVVVTISILIAAVSAPLSVLYPWILAVPGFIVSYVWGEIVASQLDNANVAKLQD